MLEISIFLIVISVISLVAYCEGHRAGYQLGVEDGKQIMAVTLDHYEARIYELTQGPGTAQRVRGA